ncbi:hypothetical protein [Paenibacillus sp. y28]|uniref:hypothetical protein n=1 Tax=Paenibacillus sp. y28 TaxID=3129110 RepID=UPI0030176040
MNLRSNKFRLFMVLVIISALLFSAVAPMITMDSATRVTKHVKTYSVQKNIGGGAGKTFKGSIQPLFIFFICISLLLHSLVCSVPRYRFIFCVPKRMKSVLLRPLKFTSAFVAFASI